MGKVTQRRNRQVAKAARQDGADDRDPSAAGGDDRDPSAKRDKGRKRVGKTQQDELDDDDAAEKQCADWIGRIVRFGFMAYSLLGVFRGAHEWATRPTTLPPSIQVDAIDLRGVNAIVTGGCGGLGRETAAMLASRGARVVVGCRRSDRGVIDLGAGGGFSAVALPLDLGSFASTRAFASAVVREEFFDGDWSSIDVLVHNAATSTACANTTDAFESSLQINYLAPVLLNRLLLPAMKSSARGARVTHVSCVAASASRVGAEAIRKAARGGGAHPKRCAPAGSYAASKRLLERHAVVMSSKFHAKHGIQSFVVDPGATLTNFNVKGNVLASATRIHPAAVVSWMLGKVSVAVFGPHGFTKFFTRSVEHSAAAVAHVAAHDALRGVSGRTYSDVRGAFTAATGCAKADAADCGWARPREPRPRKLDAAAEERQRERDRVDAEIWKETSRLLAPWSEPLFEEAEGGAS